MALTHRQRLGEMLVAEGVITEEQLQQALAQQKKMGKRLGDVLISLGFASEETIAAALGRQLGIPYITLSHYEIDPQIIKTIPEDIVRRYKIIPVDKTGNQLTVALADPANIYILDELKVLTGNEIIPLISYESEINRAIEQYYRKQDVIQETLKDIEEIKTDIELVADEKELDLAQIKDMAEDAPVVKLVNVIIQEAIKERASDIHIEPYEDSLRVRYRIDGVLHEVAPPPKRLHAAITSRIKILAELDIAERRLPQDGRFKVRVADRVVDMRVSCIPTIFGEKIVMRILDRGGLVLDLTRLGFEPDHLQTFQEVIRKPYGMILVTGPTGSGKTTTLYSALSTINSPTRNIMTAEDPVEYQLKGINQVQVKEDIGLTFASALRSFLRQDPDIILVGEIRDYETAEIAIKAALTGHLVLSTLHTNDAPSSITRLTDMGVQPFLVAASLLMVVAQRLVRQICPRCKEVYTPTAEIVRTLGITDRDPESLRFYRGTGCDYCHKSGYRGRQALYEILTINEKIREAIVDKASASVIKRLAKEKGMRTLRDSGILKVLDGTTTVEEVLSVTLGNEL
ncbi:MAG: type IV-A pilus assembly ATPase PilB [bacterium]|nr:type IV-A pilus assembly ATPase PilB [bacterium]